MYGMEGTHIPTRNFQIIKCKRKYEYESAGKLWPYNTEYRRMNNGYRRYGQHNTKKSHTRHWCKCSQRSGRDFISCEATSHWMKEWQLQLFALHYLLANSTTKDVQYMQRFSNEGHSKSRQSNHLRVSDCAKRRPETQATFFSSLEFLA